MEKINCLSGSKPEIKISENELKNIGKKVLLIWGSNDPFGKVETGHKIAQLLPMGNFMKYQDAGICHGLMNQRNARN
jgi:pimeloyl-ACP methyl ester carboxylesterase